MNSIVLRFFMIFPLLACSRLRNYTAGTSLVADQASSEAIGFRSEGIRVEAKTGLWGWSWDHFTSS